MNEGIRVRPARPSDLEAAAAILAEGFRDKFAAAFSSQVDKAERIIARTLALERTRGGPGLYVAESEGQVVGTIGLRRREDPEVPFWPAASVLFEELGVWAGLRAMLYLSLLDQPTGRRELYVADVAVAASFRRRGVGQALMQHAEGLARSWGRSALVLDVSAKNEAARNLYGRLGYKVQRVRRSLVTGWLLGTGEWLRMRKEVTILP